MTAVIKCVLTKWAAPWMNARTVTATVYEGNGASSRVFEKLGFELEKFQSSFREIDESKGGGRVGLSTFIRRLRMDD